jgi:hypothetical protein
MKRDICDNAGSINIEMEVHTVGRKIRANHEIVQPIILYVDKGYICRTENGV